VGSAADVINQTVGEDAGVVRDGNFAIGIKPLNDRTEGAWPADYPKLGFEPDVNQTRITSRST